mmetsp:Transcript_39068/g.125463  ORF Transcript_39068/g.125463 Transcript_39068/m.125463 type:complete len:298 (+) Transcript_39068:9-902(+)
MSDPPRWTTPENVALIAALRENLRAEHRIDTSSDPRLWLTGDVRLLRFLEGHGCDPAAAGAAFAAMMAERKSAHCDADEIAGRLVAAAARFPGEEMSFNKYLEVAVDSDVALVRRVRAALPAVEQFADTRDKLDLSDVLFFGKADVAMLLAPELGEAGLAQYYTLVLEHRSMLLDSRSRRSGQMAKLLMIRDFEGLSLGMLQPRAMRVVSARLGWIQRCFPEFARAILLVNTPWAFAAAWRMVSGLLNARTKERVQAFSAKELPEARARLLEFVDASVLPKRWGGEADDACCLPPIP